METWLKQSHETMIIYLNDDTDILLIRMVLTICMSQEQWPCVIIILASYFVCSCIVSNLHLFKIIYFTGEIDEPGDQVLVAKGGDGGSPTNGFVGQKGEVCCFKTPCLLSFISSCY